MSGKKIKVDKDRCERCGGKSMVWWDFKNNYGYCNICAFVRELATPKCHDCGKLMERIWDTKCFKCDKTFCYACSRVKDGKWYCKKDLPKKSSKQKKKVLR